MHRVQPVTQKGYLLVAHTAFQKGSKDRGFSKWLYVFAFMSSVVDSLMLSFIARIVSPVKLRRTKAKFVYGAHIEFESYDNQNDKDTLRGMRAKLVEMPPVVVPQGLDDEGPYGEVIVPEYFPPGSIMVFETQLQGLDNTLEAFCSSGADDAFGDLDLVDLNVVLYRAEGEERDASGGEIGAYNVPGMGNLVYCGLEGFMHPLRHIMRYNDLGHPLAGNLRAGTWALDYIISRLEK